MTDEAKIDEPPKDDVLDGAPDADESGQTVNDLQKQITELQTKLVKAQAQDLYAQSAKQLVLLRKAHADADGDAYQQKMIKQQLDQHEGVVRTYRDMAKTADKGADQTPKDLTASEG